MKYAEGGAPVSPEEIAAVAEHKALAESLGIERIADLADGTGMVCRIPFAVAERLRAAEVGLQSCSRDLCSHCKADHGPNGCRAGVEGEMGWITCGCPAFVETTRAKDSP